MKDILDKLHDLHTQATTEQSHFYVASCCREAIAEIVSRRSDCAHIGRELAQATIGRCRCSDCKKEVLDAWRDSDGNHCLTCLASQRDALRNKPSP